MPEPAAPDPTTDATEAQDRRLLVYLGAALLAGGLPVHEVEAEVRTVGARIGRDGVQVSATPTGVWLSFGGGGAATCETIEGTMRLDQTAEANAVAAGLRDGSLDREQALQRLIVLRRRPHLYNRHGLFLGHLVGAPGIALVLQPTLPSVLFAVVASPIVSVLMALAPRSRLVATLLPSIAAFLVALLAFGGFEHGLVESPLRTLLPPLAVLFPGGIIVTGLSELAAGAMVAGSARLAYGTSQLLLFALGVGAAAVALQVPADALENVRADTLGLPAAVLGLVLLTLGIALMESVRAAHVPWILAVIGATFAAQVAGQHVIAAAWLGAFLGAATASLGSTLVEFLRPSLGRVVVFLPSFWLLVPGSLGLVSVTQLGLEPRLAGDSIAQATSVICAIAIGIVVGTSVAASLRLATARLRHRTTGA